uniref:hypothetical protein n=1 Tax=Thelohanellus kitauei TaxID=669202 RepID=UPI003001E8E5
MSFFLEDETFMYVLKCVLIINIIIYLFYYIPFVKYVFLPKKSKHHRLITFFLYLSIVLLELFVLFLLLTLFLGSNNLLDFWSNSLTQPERTYWKVLLICAILHFSYTLLVDQELHEVLDVFCSGFSFKAIYRVFMYFKDRFFCILSFLDRKWKESRLCYRSLRKIRTSKLKVKEISKNISWINFESYANSSFSDLGTLSKSFILLHILLFIFLSSLTFILVIYFWSINWDLVYSKYLNSKSVSSFISNSGWISFKSFFWNICNPFDWWDVALKHTTNTVLQWVIYIIHCLSCFSLFFLVTFIPMYSFFWEGRGKFIKDFLWNNFFKYLFWLFRSLLSDIFKYFYLFIITSFSVLSFSTTVVIYVGTIFFLVSKFFLEINMFLLPISFGTDLHISYIVFLFFCVFLQVLYEALVEPTFHTDTKMYHLFFHNLWPRTKKFLIWIWDYLFFILKWLFYIINFLLVLFGFVFILGFWVYVVYYKWGYVIYFKWTIYIYFLKFLKLLLSLFTSINYFVFILVLKNFLLLTWNLFCWSENIDLIWKIFLLGSLGIFIFYIFIFLIQPHVLEGIFYFSLDLSISFIEKLFKLIRSCFSLLSILLNKLFILSLKLLPMFFNIFSRFVLVLFKVPFLLFLLITSLQILYASLNTIFFSDQIILGSNYLFKFIVFIFFLINLTISFTSLLYLRNIFLSKFLCFSPNFTWKVGSSRGVYPKNTIYITIFNFRKNLNSKILIIDPLKIRDHDWNFIILGSEEEDIKKVGSKKGLCRIFFFICFFIPWLIITLTIIFWF